MTIDNWMDVGLIFMAGVCIGVHARGHLPAPSSSRERLGSVLSLVGIALLSVRSLAGLDWFASQVVFVVVFALVCAGVVLMASAETTKAPTT